MSVTSSKAKVKLNMQTLLVLSEELQNVSTTDTDKNLSCLHPLKEKRRNLVEERQIKKPRVTSLATASD